MSDKTQPSHQNTQFWLDKLWRTLFNGDHTSGLLSPGQIRRERRDRLVVRNKEMAAIFDAEQDINSIHQGLKTLDFHANLIDTPLVESISTHSIIENTAIDNHQDIGLDTSSHMLKAAVRDVSVRDLEKALNLRKIAILAESDIYDAEPKPVSQQPVSAQWRIAWQETAQNVLSPELQLVYAKMLTREVAHPGRFSLGCLNTLKQLNNNDLEMLRIMAKYITGGIIFNASEHYFNTDFHQGLFELMNDIGLISGVGLAPVIKQFKSSQNNHFAMTLPVVNKALRITAPSSHKILSLPAYPVSRVCRQLITLLDTEADLAYLFELAKAIKAQGFTVALGDWRAEWDGAGPDRPEFIERMQL